MPRNKKNTDAESSSSEDAVKKTTKKVPKTKPVKKEPKKETKPPVKKAEDNEASEDELSDIEVDDDDSIANAEPGTNDEVLLGQDPRDKTDTRPPREKIDPTIPIGQLNMEQIFNYQIDWAVASYNLPLKHKMLEVKREFTGKGIKPKPRVRINNGPPSRDQYAPPPPMQYSKPPNRDYHSPRENYPVREPTVPSYDREREPSSFRGGRPQQYHNGGHRGGRGGGGGGRGGNNNARRLPQQDSEPDIYADN